ncbi:MAG: type VI secretion system protein TssA [Holosporales bacterium]|jgi:type VI secretion system ImpA family protein|nr:type VI secretion system protein TssA [Holosporales bacterium]
MVVLDIEKLSSPFVDGAGRDLRYEPLYDKIRTARFEEDSSLSRGVWMRDLKKADWSEVVTLCVNAIEHETKDLQIVCWLCEALCNLQQWNGLMQSLDLVNNFCCNCWNCCYPNRDDYLEHRSRIFDWFVDKMSERLLFMPIVRSNGIIQRQLDLSTWLTALNFDFVARKSGVNESKIQEAENSGQITLRRFRLITRQIGVNDILAIHNIVGDIAQKVTTLSAVLQEKCGSQSPSFKSFNDNLANIAQICNFALDGRVKIIDTTPELSVEETPLLNVSAIDMHKTNTNNELESAQIAPVMHVDETQEDATSKNQTIDDDVQLHVQETVSTKNNASEEVTISSSKDAYKAVGDLADFLIETDPQSPGPYLIKMISSWSGKPLPAVLDDVVTGSSEGHKILKVLSDVVRRVVV